MLPINPRRLAAGLLGAVLLGTVAWGYVHITDQSGIYVVVYDPGTIAIQLKLPAPAAPLSDKAADYNASVLTALQTWNSLLGVVQFNGTVNGSATYHNGNGVNEIVMDSTIDGDAFGTGILAVTISFTNGGNTRIESDIVFSKAFTWDSYRGPKRSGNVVDIQRVALHELGHVLGLTHPDDFGQPVIALMNSHVTDVDVLQADDIAGSQVLYGSPGFVPPNNNFANAVTLTPSGPSAQTTGSNVAATKETGEPNHAGNAGGHSVWWKWTAPSAGSFVVTTLGSNFDTTLAVYTGASVSTLTLIGSNDDEETPQQNSSPQRKRTSLVNFTAANGKTYFFAVDGFDAAFGAVTLNLAVAAGVSPTITTQPASQSVTAGSNVTFSVAASGDPTGYQWSFAGTAISGATSATLALNNVQAASAGSYSVVVSNAFGSVTSSAATLTVTAAVVVTPPPAPSSGGGGGGGAPSLWFYGALSLLGLGRRIFRRRE
jgi:hypothetical protein